MDSEYRVFCPKYTKKSYIAYINDEIERLREKLKSIRSSSEGQWCHRSCDECEETKGPLGHEVNKNYLKSIGKVCLCAECADK